MQKNIYEIFAEVENAASHRDRVNVIKFNATYALRNVLAGIFDPRIQFSLSEIPEYTPSLSPPGMGYSTIHQELGRMYLFEANNPRVPTTLTDKRKKEILIQILESLEAREAKILVEMLQKKHSVKGLTYKVVKEAIPGLLP